MSPSFAKVDARRWVVALAVVLFGCNLWGYDLWSPDEPFFGEGAREMIVDGHWLVPYVNGEVNTHKPPLFFWLIAIFSSPFGSVLSLTARLPSMLAALGTLMLTMHWGHRAFGARTAMLAGAMLATTHMFWEKARMAQIDSLLCFLTLSALIAFDSFRARRWSGRRAGLVFWSLTALAVLAKGPVGLLVPLGIAVMTLAFDRELGRWRSFAPLCGPLAFAAIIGLWVAATWWEPNYSVLAALQEHFVDRALHGMHHEQPVWYYSKVLPYALFPWSFLLPGAIILAWRRKSHRDDRFLLGAAIFVVAVFTISTEKRDLYILPAIPFLTLLSARLIAAVLGWWRPEPEDSGVLGDPARPFGSKWITIPQGAVGAVLLIASIAALFVAPRFGSELIAPAAVLAAVLGFGGVSILAVALRGHALRSVQWTAASMAVALLVVVSLVHPALEPRKSGRALAEQIRQSPVGSSRVERPILGLGLDNVARTLNFYSDGIYFDHVTADELLDRLSRREALYLVADRSLMPELTSEQRERMEILQSTRLSRKDLQFIRFGP